MTINLEEHTYNNCQNGEEIYFYYLRYNYDEYKRIMTFKITEMPKIYFKPNWKEFDLIDTKSKTVVTSANDFILSTNRMVVLDKSNIEKGKQMILDTFYRSLDKQIESIESRIRGLYTSINEIKKLQNSSMFRYKKIDKLLKDEGLKTD